MTKASFSEFKFLLYVLLFFPRSPALRPTPAHRPNVILQHSDPDALWQQLLTSVCCDEGRDTLYFLPVTAMLGMNDSAPCVRPERLVLNVRVRRISTRHVVLDGPVSYCLPGRFGHTLAGQRSGHLLLANTSAARRLWLVVESPCLHPYKI